jgi:hypothetical protein
MRDYQPKVFPTIGRAIFPFAAIPAECAFKYGLTGKAETYVWNSDVGDYPFESAGYLLEGPGLRVA